MNKPRVLIIAPHADDFLIGCGGYVSKYGSSKIYDIVCLATVDSTPDTNTRLTEELSAVKMLTDMNIEVNHKIFHPGLDRKLHIQFNDLIVYIQQTVDEHEYEKIFIPYENDTHQDHRTTYEVCIAACRYKRNIVMYETPSSIKYYSNMYIELNEEQALLKQKIAACYKSQVLGSTCKYNKYPYSIPEYVMTKMLHTGMQTRVCKYAEGYNIYRITS